MPSKSELFMLVLGAGTLSFSDHSEDLRAHGITVQTHSQPAAALIALNTLSPDIVVVPADAQWVDAALVVEAITQEAGVPCLVVWGGPGVTPEHVERCLEAGAVGLVSQVVGLDELMSVLSLAHVTSHASPLITVGELSVDLPAMAIRRGTDRIDLSSVQVSLVERLAQRTPRYVPSAELVALLGYEDRHGALKRAIAGLRRKLDGLDLPWEPVQFSNAHKGYRLVGDASTEAM
ncbi:hypothetical protein ACQBJO_16740 [Janibacter sp. G349]|uniref:hypothetical protein n=1 Tax=unclassified Janibacter TaxID=2649294 RepID=UPI003B7EA927